MFGVWLTAGLSRMNPAARNLGRLFATVARDLSGRIDFLRSTPK